MRGRKRLVFSQDVCPDCLHIIDDCPHVCETEHIDQRLERLKTWERAISEQRADLERLSIYDDERQPAD